MVTDTTSEPMQGPMLPASPRTASTTSRLSSRQADTTRSELPQETAPLTLDLVELELALDLSDIADRGFSDAVRDAARTVDGEFLFDLPASGLADDAQRLAVVCLSRDNGGRFGLVLLSANGDRVRTMEADEATAGLVQFAKAFVAVLEKL